MSSAVARCTTCNVFASYIACLLTNCALSAMAFACYWAIDVAPNCASNSLVTKAVQQSVSCTYTVVSTSPVLTYHNASIVLPKTCKPPWICPFLSHISSKADDTSTNVSLVSWRVGTSIRIVGATVLGCASPFATRIVGAMPLGPANTLDCTVDAGHGIA